MCRNFIIGFTLLWSLPIGATCNHYPDDKKITPGVMYGHKVDTYTRGALRTPTGVHRFQQFSSFPEKSKEPVSKNLTINSLKEVQSEIKTIFSVEFNKDILTQLVNMELKGYPTEFSEKADISRANFLRLKKPDIYGPQKRISKDVWRQLQNPKSSLFQYICTIDSRKLETFINGVKNAFKKSTVNLVFETHWGKIRKNFMLNDTLNLSKLSIKDKDLSKLKKALKQKKLFPKKLNLQDNFITAAGIYFLSPLYKQEDLKCIDLRGNPIDFVELLETMNHLPESIQTKIKDKTLPKISSL